MSHLYNIIRKEVKELLTPSSVVSVVVMILMFVFIGNFIGGEIENSTVLPVIGVANSEGEAIQFEDGEWDVYNALRAVYESYGITGEDLDRSVVLLDTEDIYTQIQEKGVSCAVYVNDGFAESIMSGNPGKVTQCFVYAPAGMMSSSISAETSAMALIGVSASLSSKLIDGEEEAREIGFLTSPIDYGGLFTYVNGEVHEGITPADISNTLYMQNLMIPMIIMIIILMIGSIVISSMGSEKENKTLETLLTLPISRTTIVTGKIVAAAIVGLVFGLAYMVGISFYFSSMMSVSIAGGVDLEAIGMTLGPLDYVLLMVSMFLSIVCALGICMILGAFTKSYKSAQTMTMPLSILAIIPMFVTMFSGWYVLGPAMQGVLFAIPFTHPMIATDALLNGDVLLVLSGIAYMAVFAFLTILVTVRLYNSDILITGLGSKLAWLTAKKRNN